LPYYKDLVELASDPNVLYNTYIGLMRTNYLLQNYVNAVNAAQEVLDNNLLDNERVKIEGNYILGMSNVQLERYNKALSYLRWAAKNTNKERGTEALYNLSLAYFHLENYDKVTEIHKSL